MKHISFEEVSLFIYFMVSNNFFTDLEMLKKIIFLLPCFLLSCSLDPVVIDPDSLGDYYIFCTLSPIREHQEVLVDKSIPESLPKDINDAKVSIYNNGKNIVFSSIGKGVYRDEYAQLKVKPGQHYQLKVELNNGNIITAKTTIPDTFKILCPLPGDTINHYIYSYVDTTRLAKVKWEKPKGAAFYSVYLKVENHVNFVGSVATTYRNQVFIPDLKPYLQPPDYTIPTDTLFVDATLYVLTRDSTEYFTFSARRIIGDIDFTHEELLEYLTNPTITVKNSNIYGAIGRFIGYSVTKTNIVLKVHIDLDKK